MQALFCTPVNLKIYEQPQHPVRHSPAPVQVHYNKVQPSHLWGTVLLSNVGFYQSKGRINSINSCAGELQALQESRVIWRLQEIIILETDEEYRVLLFIKPTETGPIFQATDDGPSPCMSKGPMMKQICCARVRATVALA